jgi:hypothetical protein
MAESSPDKETCEAKIAERFGLEHQLELVLPQPSTTPPETKEAAN